MNNNDHRNEQQWDYPKIWQTLRESVDRIAEQHPLRQFRTQSYGYTAYAYKLKVTANE